MDAMIMVGSPVRYTRTGTTGKIIRIEERGGFTFAELDSTHMLYRIDLLVPASVSAKTRGDEDRDEVLRQALKDQEFSRDVTFEEMPSMDSACNGAG